MAPVLEHFAPPLGWEIINAALPSIHIHTREGE